MKNVALQEITKIYPDSKMTTSDSCQYPLHKKQRLSGYLGESVWILSIIPLWAFAAGTSNLIFTVAAAIWGFVISGKVLWGMVGNEVKMIGFLEVSAFVLCLMQNASWLTAIYIHYFQLNFSIESSLNFIGGSAFSVGQYSLAIVYATCFAFFLSYLGSREIVRRGELVAESKLVLLKGGDLSKAFLLLFTLTIAEIALIASGVIGQRSIIVEGLDAGTEPWWAFILMGLTIFQILANGLIGAMLWKTKGTGKYRIWLWSILVISITVTSFLFFNKGRRWFLFCMLAHCWWFSFFSAYKPKFINFAMLCLIAFPVLNEVMTFNNFMRSSALDLRDTKGSAIEVIPEAFAKYQKYSDLKELAEEKSTNNLATRPLVAMPLAACMSLSDRERSFAFESEIVNSFIWSVPGFLVKNKQDYPVQETLLYNHFPIGYGDTADSLYLSSYISFGWGGILVYPVMMMVTWLLVLWMMQLRWANGWIVAIISASWFKFFASDIGEGSTGQMFVLLRATLALMVFGFVYYIFVLSNNRQFKKL